MLAGLITVANVPQLVKIVKERSVKDISLKTYVLLVAGNSCWLVYGLLQHDVPVIAGNLISTIICSGILCLRIFWKDRGKKNPAA